MTEPDWEELNKHIKSPADAYTGDGPPPVFADPDSIHFGGTLSRDPSWRPRVEDPVPRIRCAKVKRDGTQCKVPAIAGAGSDPDVLHYCRYHGGQLPNVAAKAERVRAAATDEILDHVHDAITNIVGLMTQADSDSVRLNAAKDLLDRAGLKPSMDLNVSVEDNRPSAIDRMKEKIEALRKQEELEDLGESQDPIQDEDVVESDGRPEAP